MPVSIENLLVTATQPNIKGIAPGIAPKNTDNGVIGFKGVYIAKYIIMDTRPKKAVLKFIAYNINKPKKLRIIQTKIAWFILRPPVGRGRFSVLVIKASLFLSIIWLNPLDAPTTKKPPNINKVKVSTENTSKAIRYEATEDRTTLKDNLYLIRVRISVNKDLCFIKKVSDINF